MNISNSARLKIMCAERHGPFLEKVVPLVEFDSTLHQTYRSIIQKRLSASSPPRLLDKMAEEDDSVTSLKKIRGTDPDLKIILHYNTTAENDDGTTTGGSRQEEITKEYEHYGLILSSVCGFIETALCIEMKEKENRVVHMHCSSPTIFEEALGYVLDPIQNRRKIESMTVFTALNLLPFYNMYDFASGRALCDDAITRAFKVPAEESDNARNFVNQWQAWVEQDPPQNSVGFLLEATVMADEMQLATAGPMTARYVNRHMRKFSDQYYLEHIQTLHPMLIKGHFLDVVEPATFSRPQIESDSFPLLFLTLLSVPCKRCWSRRIRSRHNPVLVEGAGSHMGWINGLYTPTVVPFGTADRTYVRTLDSGAKLYLRCSGSPNPVWCLYDWSLEVQRNFYSAPHPPEVICEHCRAFPPVGSTAAWSATATLYLPVPVLSFPDPVLSFPE
jgi:hypothetical protein